MLVAYTESGFAMEVFRGSNPKCTADTIDWFFGKERFPPGWRRRDVPYTSGEALAWGMLFNKIRPVKAGYNLGRLFIPIPNVGGWTNFLSAGTVKANACAFGSMFGVLLPGGLAEYVSGVGLKTVTQGLTFSERTRNCTLGA